MELLYFEECPHWKTADERLRTVAAERGVQVRHVLVRTPQEAEDMQFRGSPTILIDGQDPFVQGNEQCGLSCRLYDTSEGVAGSPTFEQIRGALDG